MDAVTMLVEMEPELQDALVGRLSREYVAGFVRRHRPLMELALEPLVAYPAIRPFVASEIDPDTYDHVIVAFSGGKDSVACLLHLLDLGVPREKIELWHHDVDGREGSDLMDWPVTPQGSGRIWPADLLLLEDGWL